MAGAVRGGVDVREDGAGAGAGGGSLAVRRWASRAAGRIKGFLRQARGPLQPGRDTGARCSVSVADRSRRGSVRRRSARTTVAARRRAGEGSPAPEFSFVQEEVTLRRPVGDTTVLRRQLEHMLEVARLPFVELQVMREQSPPPPGRLRCVLRTQCLTLRKGQAKIAARLADSTPPVG
ncbi:Scr1 family TA system antitoxin-like transcriptional regulator [Streptomyces sp. NPDC004658]|uniref:Scr1 family TA system antitoxin-like transcriptional regulator n=1 Tax=Streptomyces sp. NPDC004658 TaxID=3154672 RepID=UPI0033BE1E89